jgi:hypothetical protein
MPGRSRQDQTGSPTRTRATVTSRVMAARLANVAVPQDWQVASRELRGNRDRRPPSLGVSLATPWHPDRRGPGRGDGRSARPGKRAHAGPLLRSGGATGEAPARDARQSLPPWSCTVLWPVVEFRRGKPFLFRPAIFRRNDQGTGWIHGVDPASSAEAVGPLMLPRILRLFPSLETFERT